ncbi:MAG: Rho-binding antiterminator [Saprospiraceae bacterium]
MKNKTTDYKPIDCNIYDELVLLIMRKRKIKLEFLNGKDATTEAETVLTNIYTKEGEEFITLQNGKDIRLDKILKIDGEEFQGTCGL